MFSKGNFYVFLLLLLFASFVSNAQNANQIIEKTILYKQSNKPNNYEFTTYNKLIVTANPDSIAGRIDSVFTIKKGKKIFKKIDSSDYNFKKLIAKQHLYQTEKISKFQVKNNIIKSVLTGISLCKHRSCNEWRR